MKEFKWYVINRESFNKETIEEYNAKPKDKKGICFTMCIPHFFNEKLMYVEHLNHGEDYISIEGKGEFPTEGIIVEDLHYLMFFETLDDLKEQYLVEDELK